MENINQLLAKIQSVNGIQEKTRIDYDLMLDITRKLYDSILSERLIANQNIPEAKPETESILKNNDSNNNLDIEKNIPATFENISNLGASLQNEILFNSTVQKPKETATPLHATSNNTTERDVIGDNQQFLDENNNNTTEVLDEENQTIHELADKTSYVVDEITNTANEASPLAHTGISIELPHKEVPVIHKIEVPEIPSATIEDNTTKETIENQVIETNEPLIPASQPNETTKVQSIKNPVPVKQKDIKSTIGINDQYLFLNELFNNNRASYDTAITKINNFDNYVDAKEWIDDQVSFPLNWDKDDSTVQTFYALVEHHFKLK